MNIVDAGAVPDGTTDCTAALQTALATGLAEIPPGRFKALTPVSVKSNTMIRGSGAASVLIGQIEITRSNQIQLESFQVGSVLIQEASYRVATYRLIIDGSLLAATYSEPFGMAILDGYMIYNFGLQVRNCNIGVLIKLDSVGDFSTGNAVVFESGEIQQNTVGVNATGVFGLVISGMTIQGQTSGGVILPSGNHAVRIRDCYFEANSGLNPSQFYDVDVGSAGVCNSVLVDGCSFSAAAAAPQATCMRFQKTADGSVTNCLVWGYTKAAIQSTAGSTPLMSQIQTTGGIPVWLSL